MARREDIRTGNLRWNPNDLAESLDGLYDFLKARAEGAIDWYAKAKTEKKGWAVGLRVWAILLTSAAAVIPILGLLIKNDEGEALIAPAYASVALAAAAMFIMLDRLLGCSSGWVRYVSTALRVQRRLNEFQVEWNTAKAKWREPVPSKTEVQNMCALAKQFIADVDELIIKETDAWQVEFQSVITQIDELARPKAQAPKE